MTIQQKEIKETLEALDAKHDYSLELKDYLIALVEIYDMEDLEITLEEIKGEV